MMDIEFEKLKPFMPHVALNTTAVWEHIGEIERKITAFGGNRNPEESGEIWRNLEKIQEFLSHRNSCEKFLWWRPKTGPEKNFPGKHRKKRNPQESFFVLFLSPKNEFLKTGISNLAYHRELLSI
jgi:hypothetical protein